LNFCRNQTPMKDDSMKPLKLFLSIVFVSILSGFVPGVSTLALAVGPAFTGLSAKADTAETVYLNPAGMARLKQPSLYGNLMILYTENSTEFTVGGNEAKQKIENDGTMMLPSLYYAYPLNDHWSIGIGPNAASGLGASYGDQWLGRYILDEWSLLFASIAPSVAYRVSDKLSLGVSVPVTYSQFSLKKAVFNLDPDAPDGKFELEADGWGVGGTFGLLYEFSQQTRFGIVYRSELKVTDEGEPEFSELSENRQRLLSEAGIMGQEISLETSQPQNLSAGVFHDFGNGWTMTLDAMWLDFSNWAIENIKIGDTEIAKESIAYKDIWAVSLGATYDLTPVWTLRSGLLYVSSGVDDQDRTLFTRLDEMYGIGCGIERKFNNQRSLAVDITYFDFGDGAFKVEDVPLVGTMGGEYEKNYGVSLNVSFTL
jgi:long-chain fatty acid transport protein